MPRLGESVCGPPQCFFGGGKSSSARSLVRGLSFSWAAGRCPSPVQKAGAGWRGPGTAVGGSDSGLVSALLADHLSYGARWGNPPFARGAPSSALPPRQTFVQVASRSAAPAFRIPKRPRAQPGANTNGPTETKPAWPRKPFYSPSTQAAQPGPSPSQQARRKKKAT
ncbi:unnamed protein product [Pleuronectes platessa]|uniref:Uncharacterized protein n=1 Tax=Pleuronectes platessa TaxID=8262 RepID=A0A9N7VEF1_PLEPL|nr:unnamed protein product [Pleuronectes platessa]